MSITEPMLHNKRSYRTSIPTVRELPAVDSSTVEIPAIWRITVGLSLVVAVTSLLLNPLMSAWERNDGFPFSRMVTKKGPEGHRKDCDSKDFVRNTMKLLKEEVVMRLSHSKGTYSQDLLAKFEASGVQLTEDKAHMYVVFDNSYNIGYFGSELEYHKHEGEHVSYNLLKWPGKSPEDESGFEAITFNKTSGTYLVVQEAVEKDKKLVANVFDIRINETSGKITVIDECPSEFEFSSENKGIEGAAVLDHVNGKSYLVSLCEGNHCRGGKKGRDAGNGRIVIMEKTVEDGSCLFATAAVVDLPEEANFQDYSDLAIRHGRWIAVTSQENSAVWVGEITQVPEAEGFIELSEGSVYDFPTDNACRVEYCNIEGITWEGSNRLTFVSDKMKSKGKQPFTCWAKDQSIHSFILPDEYI